MARRRYPDLFVAAGVITHNTATVVSKNLYDVFGVLRYRQGSAQTPWRWRSQQQENEGLLFTGNRCRLPSRDLWFSQILPNMAPEVFCVRGEVTGNGSCTITIETPPFRQTRTIPFTLSPQKIDNCAEVCKHPAQARKVAELPPIRLTQQFSHDLSQFGIPAKIECTVNAEQELTLYRCDPKPSEKPAVVRSK